ncbi:MAG: hypothetical protein WAL14_05205, partial [Pseudolabrys sp.]
HYVKWLRAHCCPVASTWRKHRLPTSAKFRLNFIQAATQFRNMTTPSSALIAQAGMTVASTRNNANPPSMITCSIRLESNSRDI